MTTASQTNPAITMLDPSTILIADNVRFGLTKFALDSLRKSVEEAGEIQVPIEVEELSEPQDGKLYKLTTGERRTRVILAMNADGAGLKVPAIIKQTADSLDRTKRQLRENLERESMSPMDKAVAIKKLLDEGVPKAEIRQIFAEPGGRKGLQMAPISNAYLNMLVSFLSLPKKLAIKVRGESRTVNVQEMINDGRITVGGAYELTKVAADPLKLLSTVENLEEARQKAIDEEEREENRFLTGSKRDEEKLEKTKELETKHKAAQASLEEAKKLAAEKAEKAAAAFKATQLKPETAKNKTEAAAIMKKVAEAFKVAQEESKGAVKTLDKAKLEFDRLDGKLQTNLDNARIAAEKLEKAKKAQVDAKAVPSAKTKAQGAKDVKAAAAGAGSKPPSAAEIRKEIEELCLPGVPNKVKAIGEVFKAYVLGITTPNLLIKALADLTGEKWKGPARKE